MYLYVLQHNFVFILKSILLIFNSKFLKVTISILFFEFCCNFSLCGVLKSFFLCKFVDKVNDVFKRI